MYLYVAAPVSAIRYQCKVLETDIPYPYEDENVCMKKVMRLQVLHTYDPSQFNLTVLRSCGVTAIRGPRSMPAPLLDEVNSPPLNCKQFEVGASNVATGNLLLYRLTL